MTEPDPTLAARADYCRLLAACHYQPEPAFRSEGLFEAMAAAAAVFDVALSDGTARLATLFDAETPEGLLVDYTRLFIGPGEKLAAPYEAAWLGRDGTSPVVPILGVYAEAGFDVSDEFHDLPDHVAAELEFLYLLVFRQTEAMLRGDLEALAAAERLEQRLLAEHLGAWVGLFAAAVCNRAATPFYRVLGGLTRRFVEGERRRISAG